jgi:hypothetical protein
MTKHNIPPIIYINLEFVISFFLRIISLKKVKNVSRKIDLSEK